VLLDDETNKYVWGSGGLAYSVNKSSGTVNVYQTDGLGSVRALTDTTGNVIQTYQSDEFGIPTVTQGTSAQPFAYTGEQRDAEDGVVFLNSRIYDPQLGRFLQRDRFPGRKGSPLSLNRYSYAVNNPVLLVDPQWLRSWACRAGELTLRLLEPILETAKPLL